MSPKTYAIRYPSGLGEAWYDEVHGIPRIGETVRTFHGVFVVTDVEWKIDVHETSVTVVVVAKV